MVGVEISEIKGEDRRDWCGNREGQGRKNMSEDKKGCTALGICYARPMCNCLVACKKLQEAIQMPAHQREKNILCISFFFSFAVKYFAVSDGWGTLRAVKDL